MVIIEHELVRGGGDDQYPATGYMLEQGDHDIIIDLLRGMLAKQGMTGDEIDTALEGECALWLREQKEEWWEL